MELGNEATINHETHLTEHVLGEFHDVIVISICHVELAGGEFWIVCQINALISKLFSNLIDSIKTSYNQLF